MSPIALPAVRFRTVAAGIATSQDRSRKKEEVTMKVSVVSDDGRTIASHFGRSRGFVICTVEDGRIIDRSYRANSFTGHARGVADTGHQADPHGPILEALADCAVVISGGLGQRIHNDLTRRGISVFVTNETDVDAAVNLWSAGSLTSRPGPSCDHHGKHDGGCHG
jgi:predicted Fe-Mo cluster-binding NifX family protein